MDMDIDALMGADVPSIEGIQQTLVSINDKPAEFLHSTEWLGALEVSGWDWIRIENVKLTATCLQIFYVIDTLYDVPCRIQHIPSCQDIRKYSNIIKFYFENFGGLIMMGGDMDASSKGIAGIHIVDNDAYLLIVVSFSYESDVCWWKVGVPNCYRNDSAAGSMFNDRCWKCAVNIRIALVCTCCLLFFSQ